MGLSAGIVGLPNVGKSTIFNALTSGSVAAENYPFCTIDPNHGVVAVPDERLQRISELSPAAKVVPAFLELVDIAGLAKGAHRGEGLGNQFLGHIKNVDAVAHVIRCFEDDDVAHVEGSVDPVRDAEIVTTELIMKDLETVERHLQRVAKVAKSGDRAAQARLSPLQKAHDALSEGLAARGRLADTEIAALRELNLLTVKPVLYVANVDESVLGGESREAEQLSAYAREQGAESISLCGKMEAEIAELPPEERREFLQSMGLTEPGLHLLSRALYRLLGLQTFFSVSDKENRAWPVPQGITAAKAAGAIHSDFEKGFVKADVYTLAELEEHGSEAAIRAAGKMRSEGRDSIVHDGDIMFFKFNV